MKTFHAGKLPASACALLVLAAAAGAQDPQPGGAIERKALDKQTYETLRDIINQGADMYNGGDFAGCYRLYEGALLTLRPLLDHRPGLQKAISDGLATAKGNPSLDRRAFDLRFVIDKIRAEVKPGGAGVGVAPPGANTLWDRLGGQDNVRKVIDQFVAAAATDPKVDFLRSNKFPLDEQGVARLKRLLLEQISQASGGPLKYSGKSMREVHKGMGITDAQFDALAGHLKNALEKNGAKPEDVNAVLGVVNGTRKDIVEPKGSDAPPVPMARTLWDRLGGEDNVKKVVSEFVDAASKDSKVNFTRGGKFPLDAQGVARVKKLLVEQISQAAGGPLKYSGKSMKEVHRGMGITDAQFDALAGHLETALKKNGARPEDVKAVLDVVEGTRKDIVEPKGSDAPPVPMARTLWDRLGGEDNVKKVVAEFVANAVKDPKVDFFRGGRSPLDTAGVTRLQKLLVEQISQAAGGPLKYSGKSMKEVHRGMGITDAQFDALAGHLKNALEKNGARPEDIKAVLDAVGMTRKDIVEKDGGE